ncbi:MAG: hydantoinase/oxoprolinase family protein [Gammaproteobacteria bacterium]
MTKPDGSRPGLVLGVDAGGTFTDFVAYGGHGFQVHKVLSTPEAPERAILAGIEALGLSEAGFCIIHGTTVATNAVLEGKGARTCLVTNRGFRDLLTIGRQARRNLYDLCPSPRAPPVPRELCLETGGRIGADGGLLDPVTEDDLAALAAAVRALGAEAVAIDCLFSYLDPGQERAIEAALPAGVFVSRSSEVLPERREYERGIATWLNAYTGPKIHGYLERLAGALPATRIAVLQSAGETLSAASASRRAVHLLLSGPAGGVMGARAVARAAGHERFLTLDMGGTSTDVALVDGEVVLTAEGRLGPYPVAVPMVDIHSIGAGGGSIAYADPGGLLRVGPASSGADPGPACYGRGASEPTVTDANLVLGRLPADSKLAGSVTLDVAAARTAVGRLAARLGMPVIENVALGIVAIANEHMANALRVISLHRGLDPRRFPLFCFGGAGGLHVCDLARALGIPEALVPRDAGVLSALGMLAAPSGRQLSRTLSGVLTPARRREIGVALRTLAEEGLAAMAGEGMGLPNKSYPHAYPSLDLCYRGQAHTLNILWQGSVGRALDAFHQAHERRYGHRLGTPVELVNLRVALRGPAARLRFARPPSGRPASPTRRITVYGVAAPVPVFEHGALTAGQGLSGPAIIADPASTTYLARGWQATVDDHGHLRLRDSAGVC